jgi:hypothetical protein
LGSFERQGISTDAVPWTIATPGATWRIDSTSPTRAEPSGHERRDPAVAAAVDLAYGFDGLSGTIVEVPVLVPPPGQLG